jgi:hypothetical protein
MSKDNSDKHVYIVPNRLLENKSYVIAVGGYNILGAIVPRIIKFEY